MKVSHRDLINLCKIIKLNKFEKFDKSYVPLDDIINDFDETSKNYNLVKSYNADRFFKDFFNIKCFDKCGLLCNIYETKDRENAIVCFRSTDPDDFKDVLTDLNIGLFKTYDLQLLIAGYIGNQFDFSSYRHIFFTGHSLGGALAQYAYFCTKSSLDSVQCITFNNLGITEDDIKIFYSDMINKIEMDIPNKNLYTNSYLDSLITIENKLYRHMSKFLNNKEIHNIMEKPIGNFKLCFGFKGSDYVNDYEKEHYLRIDREQLKFDAAKIFIGNTLYKSFRQRIDFTDQMYNNFMLDVFTYYDPNDWTPNINNQLGNKINILTGESHFTRFKIDIPTIKNFGFKYHSMDLFIPYLDNDNMLKPGTKIV